MTEVCICDAIFSFVPGFCIGFVVLLLIYIGMFKFIKGHCSFDSVKQNQVDKVLDWLFLGIAGFILSCLLTPLGKMLFGI